MKRPRHYAAEILKLKTKEERRAALDSVAREYQDMVRKHVTDYFNKREKCIEPGLHRLREDEDEG
jgi:hypothetical protein